ncbi:hypothetical protein DDB_G0284005 [Dictyostelium discoideum AX4]|uniref:hypothetical protein n=1 Tax=Dictyostelium discoideum AX4 TaxID=352472 RepID=UPI00004E48F8|nr:hypothetical protein DDB_G0284005 [Dictyostelium discoideum AX4]EAL65490.1 hypothetical protein DDB_G0284005 [Dictyostelium discoideum AX4]|eukprot:XP_638836.1 hypothetical protein DDB_G0284005 [Dictyostelium discoideum AX4]
MDEYTNDFPWIYRNRKNEELGHALITKIVYTPHYNSQPIINGSGHYSIINQPIQPQQQQPQNYYSSMIV